jgi:hypothetical protein
MAKHSNDPKTDINLEDLLRLKRSERPSDEFWSDFDRDLHQRMLQSLVQKDPWYVHLLRGLTGRMAQSAGIAAAAALVAMIVVRPVFVGPAPADVSVAEHIVVDRVAAPVEVAQAALSYSEVSGAASVRDYGTEVISADVAAADAGYTHDFGMETIQVASYDAVAYAADSAHSRASFATSGVASLVF